MIENLKTGCSVSKDQVMRIVTENITADNVLDEIAFDKWFVEYELDGQKKREEFEDQSAALTRYNELKTFEEFDVMKSLIGSISDCAARQRVIENG